MSRSIPSTRGPRRRVLPGGRTTAVSGPGGHTLLELTIVTSLFSILAGLSYPHFRDLRDATESRSVARGLVLALKGAQQRSAILNRPAVAFFPDDEHVALYADLDLDGSPDLPAEASAMRFPGNVPRMGYPSYEMAGGRALTVAGVPTGPLGHPQLTLRSDGTTSSGGTLTLTDGRGVAYVVSVMPTGAINLSRQDGA